MDMGSLLGKISGTILNYKRDPYVHCLGPLSHANINSRSYKPLNNHIVHVSFSTWLSILGGIIPRVIYGILKARISL